MQSLDFMIGAAIVLIAASASANIVLMRRNATLQSTVSNLRGELRLPLNVRLPDIQGMTPSGKHVTVSFGDAAHPEDRSKLRVIFILSPTCRYCAANWQEWQHLLTSDYVNRTWKPIFVNVGPSIADDYVQRHQLAGSPVVQSVPQETIDAYRMYSTPMTIVMDGAGRARGVWTGVLNQDREQEIRRLIADPNLAMGPAPVGRAQLGN